MSWNAPRGWASGELVTAGNMNTYISDLLSYLKGSAGTVAIDSGMTIGGALSTAGSVTIGGGLTINGAGITIPANASIANSGGYIVVQSGADLYLRSTPGGTVRMDQGALAVAGGISSGAGVSASSVSATTLAGTLTTGAQGNVTSVGTLSSLVISGTLQVNGLSTMFGGSSLPSGAHHGWTRTSDGAVGGLFLAMDASDRLVIQVGTGNVASVSGSVVSDLVLVINGAQYRIALKQ